MAQPQYSACSLLGVRLALETVLPALRDSAHSSSLSGGRVCQARLIRHDSNLRPPPSQSQSHNFLAENWVFFDKLYPLPVSWIYDTDTIRTPLIVVYLYCPLRNYLKSGPATLEKSDGELRRSIGVRL